MGVKINLSIAIATYNEENNLRYCLSSVSQIAQEIVLVDGGSTDSTLHIAKEFGARIIETGNPLIFHINKQKALETCRGDWILQLDADEVATDELRSEIEYIVRDTKNTKNGYFVPRKNFFSGHWLKKGGQYPDYVIRLVRRGKAHFPQKSVHEQIAVTGDVGYLQHPLLHSTYHSIKEYWKKSNTYTTLSAQEMRKGRLPKNIFTYLEYNMVKPIHTFLSIFIRHKGFIDGVYGFLFAIFSAIHYPVAYQKYTRMELS
jgi:glycosyltransferase involved in cell wall biosynthesis